MTRDEVWQELLALEREIGPIRQQLNIKQARLKVLFEQLQRKEE